MTAPVLSPAEQAEVDRFGLHDEDVIAEMSEHFDDAIPCGFIGCTDLADVVMTTRCCGHQSFSCARHLAHAEARWDQLVRKAIDVKCGACGRIDAPPPPRFTDLFTVVPL